MEEKNVVWIQICFMIFANGNHIQNININNAILSSTFPA